MARIEEVTDPNKIRSSWERVFSSNNPFAWPFQNAFSTGRVFYPTDGCHLTDVQYSALLDTLRELGETTFFLSVIESDGLSFLEKDSGHWSINMASYEDYCGLNLTLENALYSKLGHWGIIISHEMHALISGKRNFINAIDGRYKEWAGDLRMLRHAWSGSKYPTWLEPIIRRLRTE